jgi:DNA invertase Pin-like site-specific DNA recombinase
MYVKYEEKLMKTVTKHPFGKAAGKGPLVISYLRFSKLEQAKGDSRRRQTDGAEAWAKEMGLTLTDRLEDHGISAFRGANRDGDLAAFLELVKAGTVPTGSTLIIEDLDRLSRQAPEDALELFLGIIRAGVCIVTLIDRQEYRRGELDMNRLMMSIMRICLAHEESAKKSERLAKAWANKRAKLSERPLTRQLPSWLQVHGGKIVVVAEKAAVIQNIFALALQGFGSTAICKKLNASEKACGRNPFWIRSYVMKILHNRQVLGEFQPCKIEFVASKRTRLAVGEILHDYYPRIIADKDFYAVAAMMSARHNRGGPAVGCVNVFQGIMFNGDDNSTMVVTNKDGKHRQYVSSAAIDGRTGAAGYVAFPMVSLEMGILLFMSEVRDFAIGNSGADSLHRELAAAEGQFADIASRIQQLSAALAAGGVPIPSVVKVLGDLEQQKAILQERRRELEAKIAGIKSTNAHDAYHELCSILAANAFGVSDNDQRTRLRGCVRQIIRRIDVTISKLNHNRTAAVELLTTDNKRYRFGLEVHVKAPRSIVTTDEMGNRDSATFYCVDDSTTHVVSTTSIENIKRMWSEGVSGSEIAKTTGVSVSTVYRHKPADWKGKQGKARTRPMSVPIAIRPDAHPKQQLSCTGSPI